MPQTSLDYPLGRALVPASLVQRRRPLPPGAVLQVRLGDQVHPAQVLAEAPDGGAEPLRAGLAGRVVEIAEGQACVVEGAATIVQGLVGIGGPVAGELAFLPRGESLAVVPIPPGSVIVYPHTVPLTLLQRAASGGAVAILAASVSALELEAFARMDVSVLLDGLVPPRAEAPITLVLTEGFGEAAMDADLFALLLKHAGETVLASGISLPRQNVRPEVLLPLPLGTAIPSGAPELEIAPGMRVVVRGGARRGARGQVLHLYGHPQPAASGLLLPSACVALEDGTRETVPLHVLARL